MQAPSLPLPAWDDVAALPSEGWGTLSAFPFYSYPPRATVNSPCITTPSARVVSCIFDRSRARASARARPGRQPGVLRAYVRVHSAVAHACGTAWRGRWPCLRLLPCSTGLATPGSTTFAAQRRQRTSDGRQGHQIWQRQRADACSSCCGDSLYTTRRAEPSMSTRPLHLRASTVLDKEPQARIASPAFLFGRSPKRACQS